MATSTGCPFCDLPAGRVIERNASVGIAILDAHPISRGHTLVIPVRHAASFFDTTEADREGLLSLLFIAQQATSYPPSGADCPIRRHRAPSVPGIAWCWATTVRSTTHGRTAQVVEGADIR